MSAAETRKNSAEVGNLSDTIQWGVLKFMCRLIALARVVISPPTNTHFFHIKKQNWPFLHGVGDYGGLGRPLNCDLA